MGRLNMIFSGAVFIILALMIFRTFMRAQRKKMVRAKSNEALDLSFDDDGDEGGGGRERDHVFLSFREFYDEYVAPVANAHPDWERLDGAVGVPGRKVAVFMRGDTTYMVNGASEMPALRAAREWMERNDGQDPLEKVVGGGAAGRLKIRKEVGTFGKKAVLFESM